MKKLLTLLLMLFIFVPLVNAQDLIGQSRITPASPLYFLKSVREIIELKFAPTTHVRAVRQLEFATRRIREANSLAGTEREDLIVPTLEKYASHLGELMGITDLYNESMLSSIENSMHIHTKTLDNLYGTISDPDAKRSVRTAVFRIAEWQGSLILKLNSIKDSQSSAEKLRVVKANACAFLAREASSSALNEIENELFEERAKKCSGI